MPHFVLNIDLIDYNINNKDKTEQDLLRISNWAMTIRHCPVQYMCSLYVAPVLSVVQLANLLSGAQQHARRTHHKRSLRKTLTISCVMDQVSLARTYVQY